MDCLIKLAMLVRFKPGAFFGDSSGIIDDKNSGTGIVTEINVSEIDKEQLIDILFSTGLVSRVPARLIEIVHEE